MNDMILLVDLAFIINNPWVIATRSSPHFIFDLQSFLKTVISVAVRKLVGTNQDVFK